MNQNKHYNKDVQFLPQPAKYTMTVDELLYNEVNIFDFDFPIFQEEYRDILVSNIINHFRFREIGFETYGRFYHALKSKMLLIMPYYNLMYESTLFKYDPLENYNLTETITATNTGTVKDLFSDTPAGRLEIGEDYVSTINENNASGETTTNRNTKGNIGVQTSQELIVKLRNTFLNVDEQIIEKLEPLFIQVF